GAGPFRGAPAFMCGSEERRARSLPHPSHCQPMADIHPISHMVHYVKGKVRSHTRALVIARSGATKQSRAAEPYALDCFPRPKAGVAMTKRGRSEEGVRQARTR